VGLVESNYSWLEEKCGRCVDELVRKEKKM
jgi:hypothetical protein